MIRIEEMEVKYKDTLALQIKRPITFEEGDRIGIIGANGAGKTTLLKGILNLVPWTGMVHMDISRKDIGVHLQSNMYVNTVPIKLIMETVLGSSLKNHPKALELIEFFNFDHCLKRKFKELSGGEKQRLTLILVLAKESPLVFFDEVTSGLDFETRQDLMELLLRWYQGKKTTLCFISHYYEELEDLANKILFLHKGQVIDFGNKEDLFQKYCGEHIIICKNTEKNRNILNSYPRIPSPEHLLAYSCNDIDEESLIQVLRKENIDYKWSGGDIEIMAVNAKAKYLEKRG
ncbi:MAG: ABC transporter ATP-binding protein [Tissierellia bacterium]|nr:ABC transporter ATP-binding protein [Tissierellia bacterium]